MFALKSGAEEAPERLALWFDRVDQPCTVQSHDILRDGDLLP